MRGMADGRGAWPLAKQNRVETEKNLNFKITQQRRINTFIKI